MDILLVVSQPINEWIAGKADKSDSVSTFWLMNFAGREDGKGSRGCFFIFEFLFSKIP